MGCVDADSDLVKRIGKNPTDYYVNFHNTEFPAVLSVASLEITIKNLSSMNRGGQAIAWPPFGCAKRTAFRNPSVP